MGLCGQTDDFSHEEPHEIEQMAPHVVKNHPFFSSEVRLIGVNIAAGTERHLREEWGANFSGMDDLFCTLYDTLPSDILVDHKGDTCRLARMDDRVGIFQRHGAIGFWQMTCRP